MTSSLTPHASRLTPAVFLDRDGTLNASIVRDGKPYPPPTIAEFQLLPGVAEACRQLAAAGYVLVVATNQPDVGRGTQQQAVVEAMHVRLRELVPEITLIEVCYDDGCRIVSSRRKPGPGMLLDAAQALGLDLAQSWMIGDRAGDIDAGQAAGCRTVFIDWGYAEKPPANAPHFTVKSLNEAAAIILAQPPGV